MIIYLFIYFETFKIHNLKFTLNMPEHFFLLYDIQLKLIFLKHLPHVFHM